MIGTNAPSRAWHVVLLISHASANSCVVLRRAPFSYLPSPLSFRLPSRLPVRLHLTISFPMPTISARILFGHETPKFAVDAVLAVARN